MVIQQRLSVLLLCLLLCAHTAWAETEQETSFVINAVPLGIGAVSNMDNDKDGYNLPPSLFVYWSLDKKLFWQTGLDGHIVFGKDENSQSSQAISWVSLYHGVRLRSNPDVTSSSFYVTAAVQMGYVPHSQVTHVLDKGNLYIGPAFSFGVETGKIGNRLGFIFDILTIAPMYRIFKDEDARNSSESPLFAGSFFRIGINWKL